MKNSINITLIHLIWLAQVHDKQKSAYGPHHSPKKHFLAINKLEQSYTMNIMQVKNRFCHPSPTPTPHPVLHLNKLKSQSPEDAFCKVWLKDKNVKS